MFQKIGLTVAVTLYICFLVAVAYIGAPVIVLVLFVAALFIFLFSQYGSKEAERHSGKASHFIGSQPIQDWKINPSREQAEAHGESQSQWRRMSFFTMASVAILLLIGEAIWLYSTLK
jgi:hypothetical protein